MIRDDSYEHPSQPAMATAPKAAPPSHSKPSRMEIEPAENGFAVVCFYDGGESTKKVFSGAAELVSFVQETYGSAQGEAPLGGGGLNMARPAPAPPPRPTYSE